MNSPSLQLSREAWCWGPRTSLDWDTPSGQNRVQGWDHQGYQWPTGLSFVPWTLPGLLHYTEVSESVNMGKKWTLLQALWGPLPCAVSCNQILPFLYPHTGLTQLMGDEGLYCGSTTFSYLQIHLQKFSQSLLLSNWLTDVNKHSQSHTRNKHRDIYIAPSPPLPRVYTPTSLVLLNSRKSIT